MGIAKSKGCFGDLEKVEEELGAWGLEDDCLSYLVEYLKGKDLLDFIVQVIFYREFKLQCFENIV